jgi:hypothetical protein
MAIGEAPSTAYYVKENDAGNSYESTSARTQLRPLYILPLLLLAVIVAAMFDVNWRGTPVQLGDLTRYARDDALTPMQQMFAHARPATYAAAQKSAQNTTLADSVVN